MNPALAQHILVIALASLCALTLLVRRLWLLRAKLSACSACSYAAVCEGRGEGARMQPAQACAKEEDERLNRRRLVVIQGPVVEGR